jgi:heme oxygenase (biliverdin-IX-beta and delta-forming)
MRGPLLQRLKQETAPLHEQLEQQLQLLRPDMTAAEYRTLLEHFYAFYRPWEERAVPLLERHLPGFMHQRSKVSLLEKDLRLLGSDVSTIRLDVQLPDTSSFPALLGSLYVMEGATLGGQILARHFQQQFRFTPEQGCAFFSSYGPDVGRNWLTFCEILTCHSSRENDDAIVQSAMETFRCLGKQLLVNPLAAC